MNFSNGMLSGQSRSQRRAAARVLKKKAQKARKTLEAEADRRVAEFEASAKPVHAQVCRALCKTLPVLMAAHYSSLKACYVASTLGVRILRKYGFEAHSTKALAAICSPGNMVVCGKAGPGDLSRVSQLLKTFFPESTEIEYSPTDSRLGHAVILSQGRLIDLTVGQVNQHVPGLFPWMSFQDTVAFGEPLVFDAPDGREIRACWIQPSGDTVSEVCLEKADLLWDQSWDSSALSRDCRGAVAQFLMTGDVNIEFGEGEAAQLLCKLGFAE